MLDGIFSTVITNGITPGAFAACTLVSLLAGLALSLSHMFKSSCSKSFAVAVALLPFTVQAVIMLVNGNLGTGVAVAGAFSLVRFRSAPGSAKEIIGVFTAMAAGSCLRRGLYRRSDNFHCLNLRREYNLHPEPLRRAARQCARA